MLTFSIARADLQRVSAIPAIWERTLQQAAYKIAVKSANTLREDAPKASSLMTNSIRPYATPGGAEVAVGTNYAGFVHDGRRPGKVDPFAIADWVRLAGLPAKAAFPIARSISKKGTRPQPWVRDFVKSVRMRQMVQQVLRDAVV